MKIIPAQLKLNSGENPTFSKSPKETSALSLLPSQVETMRLARKRSNVNEKQKMRVKYYAIKILLVTTKSRQENKVYPSTSAALSKSISLSNNEDGSTKDMPKIHQKFPIQARDNINRSPTTFFNHPHKTRDPISKYLLFFKSQWCQIS